MFSSQLPCIFPFLILPPSPSCFLPSVSPLLSLRGRSGIWGQTQNHMTVSLSTRAPKTSTFTSEWKLFAPQLRRGYLRLSLASHCLQFFCPLWLLCNVCKLHGMIVVSPFLFPHSWFLPVSVFLHQQQKKRRQQQEEEETVLFFSGMSHRAKFRALVSVLPSPPLPLLYSCSSCSPSMQMRLK